MVTQLQTPFDEIDPSFDGIDAEEGIRQGLEDARAGRLQPVREFFAEFEALHPELRKETPRTVR
jgi:hypothetical protein